MTSGVLLTRARLWVASVLAVSIPVVLFAACRVIKDCPVIPCVKTCGGPVVTEIECEECPPGLIDGTPLICGTSCDDPAPWEGCGSECPEGLIALIGCQEVECVEQCDGTIVATVFSLSPTCPPGSFDITACNELCESEPHICVDHCGGEILYVRCWPCSNNGLVDRSTCVDAGADGG